MSRVFLFALAVLLGACRSETPWEKARADLNAGADQTDASQTRVHRAVEVARQAHQESTAALNKDDSDRFYNQYGDPLTSPISSGFRIGADGKVDEGVRPKPPSDQRRLLTDKAREKLKARRKSASAFVNDVLAAFPDDPVAAGAAQEMKEYLLSDERDQARQSAIKTELATLAAQPFTGPALTEWDKTRDYLKSGQKTPEGEAALEKALWAADEAFHGTTMVINTDTITRNRNASELNKAQVPAFDPDEGRHQPELGPVLPAAQREKLLEDRRAIMSFIATAYAARPQHQIVQQLLITIDFGHLVRLDLPDAR